MTDSNVNQIGREKLAQWQEAIQKNNYQMDPDYQHNITFYFKKHFAKLNAELNNFAEKVTRNLDALVIENNLASNLPRLDAYDGIGNRIDHIVHHPTYEATGNIIYSANILGRMSKPGGLLEGLSFFFLSSATGEAGHHCPMACSAGIVRVLQKIDNFPQKKHYLEKLLNPSYSDNYTGAQFLTEIQGGSDVGNNATMAYQDKQGQWRIKGEKWFCSNADAELIFVTARYNPDISGTRGLGLFLIPAHLDSGAKNHYTIRRLKDKLGTRSMASGEIDFNDAYAIAMGPVENGFTMVMENVLHISRLMNTISVLGMGRRAYYIAKLYTQYREAFEHPILEYPLVKENLAAIKAENTLLLAAIFATIKLQDTVDAEQKNDNEKKLLLRLLANLNKAISALWTVDHIHHAIDMLAGNGAIESFSVLPRLFRDSIVCENWEGTHNTLRMQILRDILKYKIDDIFINFIETEFEKIPASESRKKTLKDSLEILKSRLKTLRQVSSGLQTLHMPSITEHMLSLYGALNLLIEGLDQATTSDSQSKLACFDYFFLSHLNDKPIEYNQKYLELLENIVEK